MNPGPFVWIETDDNCSLLERTKPQADADGVEGMSASKMRKAVIDDDFESFRKGTPKKLNDTDAQALFNAVHRKMTTVNVSSEFRKLLTETKI